DISSLSKIPYPLCPSSSRQAVFIQRTECGHIHGDEAIQTTNNKVAAGGHHLAFPFCAPGRLSWGDHTFAVRVKRTNGNHELLTARVYRCIRRVDRGPGIAPLR